MYKGKFVSELSMNDVKEYYDELRQKYPHTEEQRADFNILKEKLIAFAYKILDGKTNGDMIKAMFNPYKICKYEFNVHVYMTERNFEEADYQMNYDRSWWNAPYKAESEDRE